MTNTWTDIANANLILVMAATQQKLTLVGSNG
jgi:hypothetical protein